MAITRSEVTIVNQALNWLGQESLTSLGDNNAKAEWMNNNYTWIRNAVLEEAHWTFAEVREVSTVTDLDGWGNLFRHAKPVGWSKIYGVYASIDKARVTEWKAEGAYLLASSGTVYLLGTQIVSDVRLYSELFTQALATRLAAEACMALTENRALMMDMWGLYEKKLKDAIGHDAQQGSNQKVNTGRLTGVRV